MISDQPISQKRFIKRLVDLCLRSGLSGFPKNSADQHILFKSAVITLGNNASFTEKEINEKLIYWIENISKIKDIDHFILRRSLVDTGYLTRNRDGSCYQVNLSAPRPQFFEDAIDQVDILEVIKAGQEEITRRKSEYLEKQAKKQ